MPTSCGRLVDADTAALTLALAGKFAPTEEMFALAEQRAAQPSQALFPRIRGVLRSGVEPHDLLLVLELVSATKAPDRTRTEELRHRYLAVILDGLRTENAEPLPGPPPSWQEITERWRSRSQPPTE